MAIDDNAEPVGTGQEGAGSPLPEEETSTPIKGSTPEQRIQEIANRQARRGFQRQTRQDPTPFTK
jgi:hypothetical protein